MKKIHPERFEGTEFIRLSSLPFNQMLRLKDWLGAADIFSISSHQETIANCVHYDVYDFWYDHFTSEKQLFEPSLI